MIFTLNCNYGLNLSKYRLMLLLSEKKSKKLLSSLNIL